MAPKLRTRGAGPVRGAPVLARDPRLLSQGLRCCGGRRLLVALGDEPLRRRDGLQPGRPARRRRRRHHDPRRLHQAGGDELHDHQPPAPHQARDRLAHDPGDATRAGPERQLQPVASSSGCSRSGDVDFDTAAGDDYNFIFAGVAEPGRGRRAGRPRDPRRLTGGLGDEPTAAQPPGPAGLVRARRRSARRARRLGVRALRGPRPRAARRRGRCAPR